MKTKLILVEGIPGSGKSTMAKRIADHLAGKGETVRLYQEGDAHPADLAWHAVIPEEQLPGVLARHSALRDQILANLIHEHGDAIVAYHQVKAEDYAFYQDLERYEIYDARVPEDRFRALLYRRWKEFGLRAQAQDALSVFECAFLQNNVSELLGFYSADEGQVLAHLNRLLDGVRALRPVLIYLSQPDVRETVLRVAEQRVSPHGNWIDAVIEYQERTPHGKALGRSGLVGVLESFEERKQLELSLLPQLPVQSVVLENPDYNWEALWEQIRVFIDAL